MLAGDVVEDEVELEAHPAVVQGGGEGGEVLHRAQVLAHAAVVLHGVAAVGLPGPRLEQRHQMQVGHRERLQVVQMLLDAAQGAREAVGVGDVGDLARVLQPVGGQQARLVEAAQGLGAVLHRGGDDPQHALEGLVGAVAVAGTESGAQVVAVAGQAQVEGAGQGGVDRCGVEGAGVRRRHGPIVEADPPAE